MTTQCECENCHTTTSPIKPPCFNFAICEVKLSGKLGNYTVTRKLCDECLRFYKHTFKIDSMIMYPNPAQLDVYESIEPSEQVKVSYREKPNEFLGWG